VAVTVTQMPPPHPDSAMTPDQFATATNTGTVRIDAVPSGGDDSTLGGSNPRSILTRMFAAVSFGGIEKTHR
jgi:hypothetical protein